MLIYTSPRASWCFPDSEWRVHCWATTAGLTYISLPYSDRLGGLTATQPPVFPASYAGRGDEASQTAYGSTPVTGWPEESRSARISVSTSSNQTAMNAAVELRPTANKEQSVQPLFASGNKSQFQDNSFPIFSVFTKAENQLKKHET